MTGWRTPDSVLLTVIRTPTPVPQTLTVFFSSVLLCFVSTALNALALQR